MTEPKRYPKPDYDRCNAGHKLVEVYDEKRNAFIWDCPICIRKMQEAETMDADELENSTDIFYWNSCVKAIADGEMHITSIEPKARKQILEDVEHYKETGEFKEA